MVTERGKVEDRSNKVMRELRDKMDDIVTDTRINMCLLTKKLQESRIRKERKTFTTRF